MSYNQCRTCAGWMASILETEGEIRHMLRTAEKRPGTMQAINSLARIPVLKERLRKQRELLASHEVHA